MKFELLTIDALKTDNEDGSAFIFFLFSICAVNDYRSLFFINYFNHDFVEIGIFFFIFSFDLNKKIK